MKLRYLLKKSIRKLAYEYRVFSWDFLRTRKRFVTTKTQQGTFTLALADNDISRSLYCTGQYELEFTSTALSFLRSIQKCPPKGQGTILDVGANNGVISIGTLHRCEMARAIAVEPDPFNFSLLRRNVELNGAKERMICLPYAVSDVPGDIAFEISGSNLGDHRVRTNANSARGIRDLFSESERPVATVRAAKLDDLLMDLPGQFAATIAVAWFDIQGHEAHAFCGAEQFLLRGTPVISEIWPYGLDRSGITPHNFCALAETIWSNYCVLRRGRFVRYPISMLLGYFEELGYDGDGDNVIFLK